MTGDVTWSELIWIVGLVIGAGGIVSGFLFWVWRVVQGIRGEVTRALADRDLKIEAATARAQVIEDGLSRELNDYKQHAGETFATKAGVNGAVERVEAAVGRLSQQVEGAVDRLSNRIDRLLETRPGPKQ